MGTSAYFGGGEFEVMQHRSTVPYSSQKGERTWAVRRKWRECENHSIHSLWTHNRPEILIVPFNRHITVNIIYMCRIGNQEHYATSELSEISDLSDFKDSEPQGSMKRDLNLLTPCCCITENLPE